MRALSLVLSLLLHLVVGVFGVYHADALLAPAPPDQELIQVRLVQSTPADLPELEEADLPDHLQPREPASPEPSRETPPQQPPEPPQQALEPQPEAAPERAPEPSRQAAPTPQAPPAAVSPALEARWAGPDPGVPEGATAISPVKRPTQAEPRTNATEAKGPIRLQQGQTVNIGGKNVTVKVGAVGRTLAALVEIDFDESDYAGHYITTTGQTVLVIDGREVVDALVLQDPRHGITRRLERTNINTFIFAYGPTFQQTSPAEGSLTFLPGDENYIHRFIWLPVDMPAEFPVKVRTRQKRVRYVSGGRHLTATVYLPPEPGEFPGVVLAAQHPCEPTALHASFGRMLASFGVVSMVPDGPMCGSPQEQWAELGLEEMADNAWSAMAHLSNLAETDATRVGVWTRGARGMELAASMAGGRYMPFAVVSLSSEAQAAAAAGRAGALAKLGGSAGTLVTAACSEGDASCQAAVARLARACPQCVVDSAEPFCPDFEGWKAWLCHLSVHAKRAGPWISEQ